MKSERDPLALALERLVTNPSLRLTAGDNVSPATAAAFNTLAQHYSEARAEQFRLSSGFSAINDTLLDIANGSFARRAPRTYDGDTLDALAFLVNSTSDEVQSIIARLEAESERLRATQKQLIAAERDAALGRLASGVAHEVNQPLTVITSLVEMLQKHPDVATDTRAQWLELMTSATRHIAQIVDGVRTFGRPTPFELRTTQPAEPLHNALALVAGDFDRVGIRVSIRCADDLPAILANGERLQQVFINILTNARDALVSARPEEPTVRVSAQRDGASIVFRFSDNGPGIPESDRPHLFEPFFTTKHTSGTGLGLSIAHSIVREHGGQLHYQSDTPSGATFVVNLPLRGKNHAESTSH